MHDHCDTFGPSGTCEECALHVKGIPGLIARMFGPETCAHCAAFVAETSDVNGSRACFVCAHMLAAHGTPDARCDCHPREIYPKWLREKLCWARSGRGTTDPDR